MLEKKSLSKYVLKTKQKKSKLICKYRKLKQRTSADTIFKYLCRGNEWKTYKSVVLVKTYEDQENITSGSALYVEIKKKSINKYLKKKSKVAIMTSKNLILDFGFSFLLRAPPPPPPPTPSKKKIWHHFWQLFPL